MEFKVSTLAVGTSRAVEQLWSYGGVLDSKQSPSEFRWCLLRRFGGSRAVATHTMSCYGFDSCRPGLALEAAGPVLSLGVCGLSFGSSEIKVYLRGFGRSRGWSAPSSGAQGCPTSSTSELASLRRSSIGAKS